MSGEPLKEYEVLHNGVTTRMMLNAVDAKRYGVYDEEKKREPANKAAAPPQNKAAG